MKLLANPKPEYARNPMHTSTSPIRSVRVSGSASSPIKGLRVKAMLVIGSDRACVCVMLWERAVGKEVDVRRRGEVVTE
jgi:hypothetical protein